MKKLSALFLTLLSASAFAAGPDFTALTTGIDLTTLIAAIMAVALLGIGYVMAKGGAVAIMGFIKRVTGG
jgi:hypothetical protein